MAIVMKKVAATTQKVDPYLKAEGVFHLALVSADESPMTRDNEPIDGIKLEFEVLAGEQAKKIINLTLYNQKDDDKNDNATVIQTRMFEILGVLDHSQLGAENVEIELVRPEGEQILLGRQVIAKLKANKSGFLNLDGDKFWHIDDPNAEPCERNQAYINRTSKDQRRDASTFPKKKESVAAPPASKNGTKPANQRKVDVDSMGSASKSAANTSDVDDI